MLYSANECFTERKRNMFNWQLHKHSLKVEQALISGLKTSCLAVLLILSAACRQTPNTSGIGAE